MNRHNVLAQDDERARRAVLRDQVLRWARLLGWPARTAIAFTEQVTHHPWKRCSHAELAAVLDQLQALGGSDPPRQRPPRGPSVRSTRRQRGRAEPADGEGEG